MLKLIRVGAASLALTALFARSITAQCPDGTPPPCRGARPVPVRVAVPMDPNTWVVVPFDNTTRAQDLEWLRDASVNLLYMDLSRWSDIRAVDDKRVADFLREVPSARAGQKLSLGDAQSVARRAGAGKLVMGQFLKLGARTQVSATAYDTRSGNAIRSASEETSITDSLLPLFGKVARKLLGVPPPAGANVGIVGTSRADAYQEYIAGVTALNRFDIPEATRRLTRALELDTAFALAHYKLAIAGIYDEAGQKAKLAAQAMSGNAAAAILSPPIDSARLAHAAAAARLGESLPPRERAMINGLLAQTRKDYARACELYGALARADSSDVEALWGVGECSFRDDAVEFIGGDSTRLRFRSSWNTSLRALKRALAVDPTYHLAFDHVLDILSASGRPGCRRTDPAAPCAATSAQRYSATVRRDGDSLLTVPLKVNLNEAILRQIADAQRSSARRRNLEEARAVAEQWVAAGPREGRAHAVLGRLYLRLGMLAEADREMAEAAPLLPYDEFSDLPFYRLEIALKRGNGAEVVRLYDSSTAAQKNPAMKLGYALMLAPLTGRVAAADSAMPVLIKLQSANTGLPAPLVTYFTATTRIGMGLRSDTALAIERRLLVLLKSQTNCNESCELLLGPSWMFGLRMPRTAWPAFNTPLSDRRLGPAAALATGDTAQLRIAARRLDSLLSQDARAGTPEDGASLTAADAFLMLGDSVSALAVMRRMLDTTMMLTSLEAPLTGLGTVWASGLWPRAILLRADLEMAKGSRDEAKKWYRRFLDLWAKSDAEFGPLMERVRKAVGS